MTAVDEFAVGEATSPDAPPAAPRRRHGDCPAGWVALAGVAVVVGALLGPTTPPRTVGAVLPWGGLLSFVVMEAVPGTDIVALARDAVDRVELQSTADARMPAEARADATTSPERVGAIVLVRWDDGEEHLVTGIELPSPEAVAAMEAAAPGEHWVCDTGDTRSTCTSLTSEVVLEIDEPADG